MPLTAIFDIGKTNKKFLLFDDEFKKVNEVITTFEEIEDEDGHPCENLSALTDWMRSSFQEAQREHGNIRYLNFSSYGASWVHLGMDGNPVAPLYNYARPFSKMLEHRFWGSSYEKRDQWSRQTASPFLGMLNSGLQLYAWKYEKPTLFQQIRTSLHLPQYLSYFFSGKAHTEYTSLGCHTGLWDFENKAYHPWVRNEMLTSLFPKIIPATHSYTIPIDLQSVQVGAGIHDSSAALLPYLICSQDPFILMSTGTWSITLNPFNEELLTDEELRQDCLNYLRIDGFPVKAGRLFLGNEHDLQVKKLNAHFKKREDAYKKIPFTPEKYKQFTTQAVNYFKFTSINKKRQVIQSDDLDTFENFEEAYYQLISELVDVQLGVLKMVRGGTGINKLIIDGGFSRNYLFMYMLCMRLPGYEVFVSDMSEGTALGAAIAIRYKEAKAILPTGFRLKKIEV